MLSSPAIAEVPVRDMIWQQAAPAAPVLHLQVLCQSAVLLLKLLHLHLQPLLLPLMDPAQQQIMLVWTKARLTGVSDSVR